MKEKGTDRYLFICAFVSNNTAKKNRVLDENTSYGIRRTFLRKFHFVLLYIGKPSQISN
jgi:hypothetical protein